MPLFVKLAVVTFFLMLFASFLGILCTFLLPKGIKERILIPEYFHEFAIAMLNQIPGNFYFFSVVASLVLFPASISKKRYGKEEVVFALRTHIPFWYKLLSGFTGILFVLGMTLVIVMILITLLIKPSILKFW